MSEIQETTNADDTSSPGQEDAKQAALDNLLRVVGQSKVGDQVDVKALKEKLAKFGKPSEAKTLSGAEAVDAAPAAAEQPRALTGRDVAWEEYALDYNIAHLYRDAVYRDTPQGPKWVAMVTDFHSTDKEFRAYDKTNRTPGGTEEDQESLNAGRYLKDMVNGKEQWKIAAVMPSGTRCGILLERQVPIILPDPQPLKKKEEVEAPTNPELKAVEDAALAFMENEGLTPGGEVVHHAAAETTLRAIERGTPEHEAAAAQLDEDGALPARDAGGAIRRALELNRGETAPALAPKGEQPDPVDTGAGLRPAHGYSAAADVLKALTDPAFRASLPQEG